MQRKESVHARMFARLLRIGEGAGGECVNIGGITQVGFILTGAVDREEETPWRKRCWKFGGVDSKRAYTKYKKGNLCIKA